MRLREHSPTLRVMPRDHETEVPRDAFVLVTAPRRVDHQSTSGFSVRAEERDVMGIIEISSDGRVLFWRPAEALAPRVEHRVIVTGVRDERGTAFADHASTFVTGVFCYPDLQLNLER